MRKFAAFILLLIAGNTADAQYKKASFLNKTGRIYDFGVTQRLQSGERSSSMGFFISYGKESNEKRIHHWFDTELVLPNKYNYATTDGLQQPVKVSGKSVIDFTIRYNLAYFLTDNSEDGSKLLPFINLGIGYVGAGILLDDHVTTPDTNSGLEKYPGSARVNITYGGGGGLLYRVTPKIGFRLSAAYYALTRTTNYSNTFFTLANHPAVSLAIRFRMDRDE